MHPTPSAKRYERGEERGDRNHCCRRQRLPAITLGREPRHEARHQVTRHRDDYNAPSQALDDDKRGAGKGREDDRENDPSEGIPDGTGRNGHRPHRGIRQAFRPDNPHEHRERGHRECCAQKEYLLA